MDELSAARRRRVRDRAGAMCSPGSCWTMAIATIGSSAVSGVLTA